MTLDEHLVKDIQNKDQLSSALESAMKQAANEHLAVPRRQRKSWITQDTLLLVEWKRKAKASRLKSDDAMAEYTELCKRVKKSVRRD